MLEGPSLVEQTAGENLTWVKLLKLEQLFLDESRQLLSLVIALAFDKADVVQRTLRMSYVGCSIDTRVPR